MTARLPTPGGDDGTWGDTLNTFLEVGHDSTGNNIGAVVEVSKSADYTLTTEEAGKRVICTASLTLLIPSVGTLGAGFECEVGHQRLRRLGYHRRPRLHQHYPRQW